MKWSACIRERTREYEAERIVISESPNNGIVCYTLYLEAVGMYAGGVRRGKSGIGDSVEKQLHDEKKDIYN